MKGRRGGISGTGLSLKSPLPPFFKGGDFFAILRSIREDMRILHWEEEAHSEGPCLSLRFRKGKEGVQK